jgi:HrpA-like RNA helicase
MIISPDDNKDRLLAGIFNSRFSIVVGPTGSGKSTYVPIWLSQQEAFEKSPRIVCIQPRRVSAISLARRVNHLLGYDILGQQVGYRIRGDVKDSESCKITYMTSGYLRTALACNPSFLDFATHLILDEAHERSVDADFLSFMLRDLLTKVEDLSDTRLIVMSATIETHPFREYFGGLGASCVPIIELASRLPFAVEELYLEDIGLTDDKFVQITDMLQSHGPELAESSTLFAEFITELIMKFSNGGMTTLVFLPGEGLIESVERILQERIIYREKSESWDVHVLHSQVPIEDQKAALIRTIGNGYHIVLATNIAESSLTVEGVDLVIDSGMRRQACFDHSRGIRSLQTIWASKANLCQRKGRTGRVCNGRVIRVFTREIERKYMSDYEVPESLTANPSIVLLGAMFLCERWAKHKLIPRLRPLQVLSQLMTASHFKTDWTRVIEELCEQGVVQSPPKEDSDLTIFGSMAAWLQLEPQYAKLVFLSLLFGCPIEGIVLAAAASMEKDVLKFSSKFQPWQERSFAQRVVSSIMHRVHYDAGFCSELIMVRNLIVSSLMHRARYDSSPSIFAPKFYSSGVFMAELDGLKSLCSAITRSFLDWIFVTTGRDESLRRTDPSPKVVTENSACLVTREKVEAIFDSLGTEETESPSHHEDWMDQLIQKLSSFMDIVNSRKNIVYSASDLGKLFLPLHSYEEADVLKLIITMALMGRSNLLTADASFPRCNGEAFSIKRTWDDPSISAADVVTTLTGGIAPISLINEDSRVSLVLSGFTDPEMAEMQPEAETASVSFPRSSEFSPILCSVGIRIILSAFDKVWRTELGIKDDTVKIGKPYIYNICRWYLAGTQDRVLISAKNPVSWLETNRGCFEIDDVQPSRNSDGRRECLSPTYFSVASRIMSGKITGSALLRAEGVSTLPVRKCGRVAVVMLLCSLKSRPLRSVDRQLKSDGAQVAHDTIVPMDPRFPISRALVSCIDAVRLLVDDAIRLNQFEIASLINYVSRSCKAVSDLMEAANEGPQEPEFVTQVGADSAEMAHLIDMNTARMLALRIEVDYHLARRHQISCVDDLGPLVDEVYSVYNR